MEIHSITKEVASKMGITICPKCNAELKFIAVRINHKCGSLSSRVTAMNKYLSNSNTVGRLRK
jgi:ribosomal protein L40E